jgi:hypothetical protein
MDDRRAPPARNSSRTLAMVAVIVLVVIAIAGIALASMRGPSGPAGAAAVEDATPGAASGMTAAVDPALLAAEKAAGANIIVFAPGSDRIPEISAAKLERLAEKPQKAKPNVVISGRVQAGPDQAAQLDLAHRRAMAIRAVLEDHRIPLRTMHIEIAQAPGLPAEQTNRFEVSVR